VNVQQLLHQQTIGSFEFIPTPPLLPSLSVSTSLFACPIVVRKFLASFSLKSLKNSYQPVVACLLLYIIILVFPPTCQLRSKSYISLLLLLLPGMGIMLKKLLGMGSSRTSWTTILTVEGSLEWFGYRFLHIK